MKLLTRIGCGLARSGGLINLINQERSLFQQARRSSIHVVPTPSRRHMVTCRKEREPCSGQGPALAPAADGTRWMVLNRWCCATKSTAVDVVANADAKTVAETHTSRSRPLRVSLSRAAPPAISFLCFDDRAVHGTTSEEEEGGGGGKSRPDDGFSHAVVAAHGDSVLLRFGGDHFVYKIAAGQPPSLSLLPACRAPMYRWEEHEKYDAGEVYRTARELDQMNTGLLPCDGKDGGGGEFLVAQLQVTYEAPFDTAELCVFRHGRPYWELKDAVPVVHHEDGERHDLGRYQVLNAAVPAGNRFLCWASYDHSTLLVCDMLAEEGSTKLRYVPLPVKAAPPKEDLGGYEEDDEDQLEWLHYRSIVGAVGTDDAAVRFVSIDRSCCCGAPVVGSVCEHSGDAFTVTTWTLALRTTKGEDEDEDEPEPMAWVKEGALHCEELWALLAGFDKDIPRRAWPTCPVVSSENPDVVCFLVGEREYYQGKRKMWALEVDMRRKTLISVVPCAPHPNPCEGYANHLPAKLHT